MHSAHPDGLDPHPIPPGPLLQGDGLSSCLASTWADGGIRTFSRAARILPRRRGTRRGQMSMRTGRMYPPAHTFPRIVPDAQQSRGNLSRTARALYSVFHEEAMFPVRQVTSRSTSATPTPRGTRHADHPGARRLRRSWRCRPHRLQHGPIEKELMNQARLGASTDIIETHGISFEHAPTGIDPCRHLRGQGTRR